jgi:hypothetical protein
MATQGPNTLETMLALAICTALLAGCEASSSTAGPGDDGATDVDSDTDADSDTDTDSDSDSDTGDTAPATECLIAAEGMSYRGCEYWTTTLANVVSANHFNFAVALANEYDEDAAVEITDGLDVNNSYTVPAGEMLVIEDLPWKTPIKDISFASARRVANTGYKITSSLPVAAYQFSPLRYQSGETYSQTNDASLLLPAHVLGDEYVVQAGPAGNSIFAVVGTGDQTATLEITLAAPTGASDGESNESYPQFPSGTTFETEIHPHEVLQMVSHANLPSQDAEAGMAADLSGTIIRVLDGPNPAVFGGHRCTYVPFDVWACDHLEEQMFPLATWGTDYLCAHHITQDPGEPTIWTVMSGADDNEILFDPPSVYGDGSVVLDKGEYVRFESYWDFAVSGQNRTAVARFMVGQQYTSETDPPENGDPAMALETPMEQYRSEYIFLSPDTYVHNYLTVIHEDGDTPELDGAPIAGDTVDIAVDHVRTNLEIPAGIHQITSGSPFGILVYGVGSYTSYMYPGGLDLEEIEVE